ncbi:MAG TPA: hypothetical protein VGP82_18570 [Ktedonobacterales bacterium]|nr:hypothetical protein [Ktedonobacterales bacterium]
MHNIPLQLNRVDQGNLTPDDVLVWLRGRAQGTLMDHWFNLRVPEMVAEHPDRQVAQDSAQDENEPH